MSKKAIAKLSAAHKSYDLTVESTSINEEFDGRLQAKPAVKAIITIFDHTEKGAVILKKSAAYGQGSSFEKAQSDAITKAVEGLGL